MLIFGRRVLRKVLVVFVSVTFFANLFAQNEGPSMEPAFSLFGVLGVKSEAGNTNYTADEVFEMSLLFSECERGSEAWNRCWKQFEEIKKEVASDEIMSLDEEDRGRAILKLLYRDYLAAYSLTQTKVNVAMDKGFYNCVSSAVLYMATAKASGLYVLGNITTHHYFF